MTCVLFLRLWAPLGQKLCVCVCVGLSVTFRLPVCSRCSLNTEWLNWVSGQVGSAIGFTSGDRASIQRWKRWNWLSNRRGSSFDRKEQDLIGEGVWVEECPPLINQLLLIHLQALWPSLSCLGARSREARSCGGEGEGRLAITNTHS